MLQSSIGLSVRDVSIWSSCVGQTSGPALPGFSKFGLWGGVQLQPKEGHTEVSLVVP